MLNQIELDNDEILIPYRKFDKWGYCTLNKEIKINPIYISVRNFVDGFAIAYLPKEPLINIINKIGESIIPNGFEPRFFGLNLPNNDRYFYEGLGIVDNKGKQGFVNKLGEVVITPIYDKVTNFTDGLAGVLKDKKWGFVNLKGELIIDCKYVRLGVYFDDSSLRRHGPFNEGYARVADGINQWFKYSFIDKEGNLLIDFTYDYAEDFNNGIAKVGLNKYQGKKVGFDIEYGLIDIKGNLIAPCIYDNINLDHINEGFAIVEQRNKRGLVDISKNVILPCKHDFIGKRLNDQICNNKSLKIFYTTTGYLGSDGTEYWED